MSCDFQALANAGVQKLMPYQPGKPVEELERELGISESIKLASNENPLGPSPRAIQALGSLLDQLAQYPDGNGFALRNRLAEKLGVEAECITLGNGSNDVLELIARAYLAPGRSAVFSAHAFAVYPLAVQAVGAEARVAAAHAPDHAMPWGHDLAAMADQVTATTRVIFVANPNNPTGTWVDGQSLHDFIAAQPADTLVVVDEAYCEYVEEPDYPDATRWLAEFPNLIVTRTFSKIHGLAGLRIGYAVSHPQVADILNRVRQPFNTNALAQAAALEALDDDAHVRQSVQVNREGLQQLGQAFDERGLGYIPSVGNFICVDVGGEAEPVYQALLHQGVIVRPVGGYGLPRHLRVTVGRAHENRRFIDALDQVLKR
ncbi:aspartate aminotransferase [Ectothiorhodospira haloalkaliphila]|uniref:Histidinol-phosphate aminotransferase n=1 Tax=Ectothiorhodospira haloalkaliphila TaxID=421628 RepID=W8KJ40_9GAMM|nr:MULTISPECIES: histidinol-phosphate transaminase [Ectothiorhodospira]AHK79158.1 aspartate aminotransferase [Ectothiorhodospira haloalkaliphila]MCG5498604.1 histidinol-phosphate transaminase [Ectothiorhodospira variabilis]